MRLPATPTPALVNYLNTTYFGELWNAADDHGRRNFRLSKVTSRLSVGSVSVNLSVVGLPTTGTVYTVYQIPAANLGRFVNLPTLTWITDDQLRSTEGIQFTTYTAAGRTCPNGVVSFYFDPIYSVVLVAIPYLYSNKCTGEVFPDLYMTVYKDTTRSTPIVSQTFVVSGNVLSTSNPTSVNTAITTQNALYPRGTTVIVNGYVWLANNVPTLVAGDVVEILSDPDMVGHCDITVDDTNTGYYSTLYGEYREVIHIQKSLNPNNVILTNDIVDVVIIDPATGRGLYGHRVDIHAIMSITHNDFSMSRSVLQAFMNNL